MDIGRVYDGGTRSDGSAVQTLRLGQTLEQIVGDAHGRYYEMGARGNSYMAAMQAGAALGTALTATAVTLTLYNPVNSGVLLSIIHVGICITTAPAGSAAIVYAANVNPLAAAPSATTSLSIRSQPLGNGTTGKGACYSAATLPAAPVVVRGHSTVLATGSTSCVNLFDEVAGAIVLGENTAITIQNIGTATSGIVSMLWEEIPHS